MEGGHTAASLGEMFAQALAASCRPWDDGPSAYPWPNHEGSISGGHGWVGCRPWRQRDPGARSSRWGQAPPPVRRATAAASAVEQAFTITTSPVVLKSTDVVTVSGPGSGNNVAVGGARINATGQLVIQFINPTAGALTHAGGSFVIHVRRI